MIRRDEKPDLAIALEAERLGRVAQPAFSLGKSDHAKETQIARYRKSRAYKTWLSAWESRNTQFERELGLVRERYGHISELMQGGFEQGFDGVSMAIQTRALTMAAEADDDTLREALSGRGWIANILKLAGQAQRDSWRKKCDELKTKLTELVEAPRGPRATSAELVAAVDEVMGIPKQPKETTDAKHA